MRSTLPLKASLLAFLFTSTVAFAQSPAPTVNTPEMPPRPNLKCQNLWYVDEKTPTCQQKRFCGTFMYKGLQTFATEVACRSAAHPAVQQKIKEERKENLQERQANLQERAAQLRETLQKKRAEAQAKFKTQRDAFKERLETIKDARKKTLVERLDNRMAVINKNRTEAMSNHLQRMREILGRVEEKTANVKANGQDVSTVETIFSTAETAISKAETAVANQAGKEYVANITYESTLKNTVGAAMKQLEADLKAAHQTVIEAKKAVMDAAKALAKVVGQGPKATPIPATGEPTETE